MDESPLLASKRLGTVHVTFREGGPFKEQQVTHLNARVTRQSLPTFISVYREIVSPAEGFENGKVEKVEISYRTEDIVLIEEIR